MATEKRLIDANALLMEVMEGHPYEGLSMAAQVCTMELLTYAPTVDAVEVVRCKDCKHRVELTKMCAHPRAMGWDALETEDDDFCSCGERKDNE